MTLSDLERRGLRAIFEQEISKLDAKILENETRLRENANQHDAWKNNLRQELAEDKGQRLGFKRSLETLNLYKLI